jgi:hypothetical protein
LSALQITESLHGEELTEDLTEPFEDQFDVKKYYSMVNSARKLVLSPPGKEQLANVLKISDYAYLTRSTLVFFQNM